MPSDIHDIRSTPVVPGLTRDENRVVVGDTPEETADGDVLSPFYPEDGPLGVADDDTIGVSEDDDSERERGATEA